MPRSYRQAERELKEAGFVLEGQVGSARKFRHPSGERVMIHFHGTNKPLFKNENFELERALAWVRRLTPGTGE
jgi:hypothetical protein